jgi:hypothetical protein
MTGALWTLGEADLARVRADLASCAGPASLGDFLAGLFHLAREVVQRHPALAQAIDELVMGYADDAFLEALPSLRLAFSYFAPREKHHLAATLFAGRDDPAPPARLAVDPATAARAFAVESRVRALIERYGLGFPDVAGGAA